MSKEMLSEKLKEDQGFGPESPPIVTETNKGKRERLMVVFLIAVGIGILVLASIFLLPYVNSLGGNILGGRSSAITYSGSAALEATTPLPSSFIATDAKGDVIKNGDSIARSEQLTLTGYSNTQYSTEMLCTVDMLPVYCDGGPIIIPELPAGKHTITIMEPSNGGETMVRVFSWVNISS
jgi:hypothetical protein